MARSEGRSTSRAAAQTQHVRRGLVKIRADNANISFHDDLYPFILKLSWARFFALYALTFVAVNLVFAVLYLVVPGSVTGANGFVDHFFFSIETLATIGYGEMTPNGTWAHSVMSLEAFVNMGATAVMTGLAFARFARPTAQVLFSDRMVIAPWNGVPHLMFRMANQRQNQLAEAVVNVTILLSETTLEGQTMRRPVDLPLLRNKNPMFALTWLAMHKIDETSPFFSAESRAELEKIKADMFVTLTGFDETLMQTVIARFRYHLYDIVDGAHFVDVVSTEPDGTRVIDYGKFHDVIEFDEESKESA